MPEGKYFWLKSQLNGLCLDLSYGEASPGNDVITWEFRAADNQLWFEDRINHVIRSKKDENLVLEVKDSDYMMVNTFDPENKRQKWITSVNRVCRMGSPNTVLAIRRKQEDKGATLKAKDFEDEPHQKWDIIHVDAVYCNIVTADGSKGIDICGADSSPGARVIVWERHTDLNQQWYEDKHGVIRSRLNDFSLDASEGCVTMQPHEEGKAGSSWVKAGKYIRNRVEEDLCLQVKLDGDSHEVPVEKAKLEKLDNQKWVFVYI